MLTITLRGACIPTNETEPTVDIEMLRSYSLLLESTEYPERHSGRRCPVRKDYYTEEKRYGRKVLLCHLKQVKRRYQPTEVCRPSTDFFFEKVEYLIVRSDMTNDEIHCEVIRTFSLEPIYHKRYLGYKFEKISFDEKDGAIIGIRSDKRSTLFKYFLLEEKYKVLKDPFIEAGTTRLLPWTPTSNEKEMSGKYTKWDIERVNRSTRLALAKSRLIGSPLYLVYNFDSNAPLFTSSKFDEAINVLEQGATF